MREDKRAYKGLDWEVQLSKRERTRKHTRVWVGRYTSLSERGQESIQGFGLGGTVSKRERTREHTRVWVSSLSERGQESIQGFGLGGTLV